MMNSLPRVALAVLFSTLLAASSRGQDPLPPEVLQALEKAAGSSDVARGADGVWTAQVSRSGSIVPALRWLRGQSKTAKGDRLRTLQRLRVRLNRRRGDLAAARRVLLEIPEVERTIADGLALAEVYDAEQDVGSARSAYEALLKRDLDADLQKRLTLRVALLGGDGRSAAGRLAKAAADWPVDLRNQAAIILALQNRHRDAIELFTVSGEGTARFCQEIRLAEWALSSERWSAAQRFAWDAVKSSVMKRDRRYALSVLVEAYRRAGELDALITRFAEADDLKDTDRLVWIDLLRETGKVDEALRLFRDANAAKTFTNDMRRQLLELCREAGREGVLVEAYEQLITEQPRTIEWREGLARFHLERGNREKALAVWASHSEAAKDTRTRLAAAASLERLGLYERAIAVANSCLGRDDAATHAVYIFRFELHRQRGELEKASEMLASLDRHSPPGAAVRIEIAGAYERMGDKRRAAEVLAGMRKARGADTADDADMKLAFLYSEIDEEEKAEALWLELWQRVGSIPRRRYVEERLMTVAARLGTLAKIAVDLETRLFAGKATDREASMLVRLYTRVNDAVSAAEVVQEHLGAKGKPDAEVLTEKARLYLSCNDHYNYDLTIRELIKADPDGRPDHLRELAMSLLERGQRGEARKVLQELKREQAGSASLEFEAGVLDLAGMREDAMSAYARSLARYPDRIDTYLLLSNMLVALGRKDLATGMFQHLAATAKKDDLFTIAIDGILNLMGPRRRPAKSPLLAWARRVTLERLARRPNKVYLYQLVADLSDEHKDPGTAKRALTAALPIAGEQRSSLLRELMSRTKSGANSSGFPTLSSRPQGKPKPDHLMFGRRLLGQGELVPPGVYLDLGTAFLAGGDVANATRTFNAASRLPEFDELQRKIADAFESAGYPKEALAVYERILTVEARDVDLLVKVAELHERLGRDPLASELFQRGFDVLVGAQARAQTQEASLRRATAYERRFVRSRSVDEVTRIAPKVEAGILATLADPKACAAYLDVVEQKIATELAAITDPVEARRLGRYPRLRLWTALFRRLAAPFGLIGRANSLDTRLITAMPKDVALLNEVVRFRSRWGFRSAARSLIAKSPLDKSLKDRLTLEIGGDPTQTPGLLSVARAANVIVPLLSRGDDTKVRRTLERLELSSGTESDLEHIALLANASLYVGDAERCLAIMRFWVDTAFTKVKDVKILSREFTTILTRTRGARILTGDRRRSLMERIVERIAAEPDRFSTLIGRLHTFILPGDDSLQPKQIEKLIETALTSSTRYTYGIPELFSFLPAEQHSALLRRIWPKVAKPQRSYFLANFVRRNEIASSDFAAWIFKEFKSGISQADNISLVTSGARQLTYNVRPGNLELTFQMIDAVRARQPSLKINASSMVHHTRSWPDQKQAWAAAKRLFTWISTNAPEDYRSLNSVVQNYATEHLEELKQLCEKIPNEKTRKRVVAHLGRYGPRKRVVKKQKTLAELRAAVAANPDDTTAMRKLRRQLDKEGYHFEAAVLDEKIVRMKPSSRGRDRVTQTWMRLHHPVRALQIGGEPATPKKPARPQPNRPRMGSISRLVSAVSVPGQRSSASTVTKALKKKDFAAARSAYRHLWRETQSSPYFGRVYNHYSNRISSPPRNRTRSEVFPAELDQPAPFLSWKAKPWKPKPRDANQLPFKIAKTPFGADELNREFRSLPPAGLRTPQTLHLIQALADVDLAAGDLESAVDAILARHDDGTAPVHDYARLGVLLEASKDLPKNVTEPILDAILAGAGTDTSRIRRLARLYARYGFSEKASALYRWCASDPGTNDPITGRVETGNPNELLEEVVTLLKGAGRRKAVATILRAGTLGINGQHVRDGFENRGLTLLISLDGAKSALAESRVLLDGLTNLMTPPRRLTAMTAAGLYARAGENERALRLLDISLFPQTPPEGADTSRFHGWKNTRPLTNDDLRWLFPADLTDFSAPATWLDAAAERIAIWAQKKRLNKKIAFQCLCVIGARLQAAEARDASGRCLAAARKLASDSLFGQHWLAEAFRRAQRPNEAHAVERPLLDAGRLPADRIAAVIAHVLETKGPRAALELGEPLTNLTLHDPLLKTLLKAAKQTNDQALTTKLQELRTQAKTAQSKLEAKR